MADLAILGVMVCCALVSFANQVRFWRGGQSGLGLSILSVIGAIFVILIFAAGRPMGIDPVRAMSGALLFALPALLGGIGGMFLGRLLQRKDDRRFK